MPRRQIIKIDPSKFCDEAKAEYIDLIESNSKRLTNGCLEYSIGLNTSKYPQIKVKFYGKKSYGQPPDIFF